jgi:hypothetical protein
MTIPGLVGEAFLVKKLSPRRNQSPNATAKGDLFCLGLNTKDTKYSKVVSRHEGKNPQIFLGAPGDLRV